MIEVLTILLGAFLSFLVQPLVGNTLLPAFGSTATVWSACLAVFQALLLGGYFYAHLVRGLVVSGHWLRWLHVVLLLVSAGWLACVSGSYASLMGHAVEMSFPLVGILLAVAGLVAVPYLLLTSNSSLVQVLSGGRYRLYAVSNIGSLAGLLAYPFFFEPYLPLSSQWLLVSGLVAAYAVLFACLLRRSAAVRRRRDESPNDPSSGPHPQFAANFLLAVVSCFLLNAVSTYLCADVAPLPLLWAVLLSLYLLSYVVAFTDHGASWARFVGLLALPLTICAFACMGKDDSSFYMPQLCFGCGLLFVGGWAVHARLYRLRPSAEGLTRYYLMIALGGAVGGSVCSFLMPLVSTVIAEFPVALAAVLAVVALDIRDLFGTWPDISDSVRKRLLSRKTGRVAIVGLVLVAVFGVLRLASSDGIVLCRYRNFYGTGKVVNRVFEIDDGGAYRANVLFSGGTEHGFQMTQGDWKLYEPSCYYADHAGGLAILSHPKRKSGEAMRVGLCGMGIGTLAAYARKGDYYRFYEINPAVAGIALDRRYFSFVPSAIGKVDVVVDDARHALCRERTADEPKYDALYVDVFTGDAIPSHMITQEAFALYLDRLQSDGILALHLTNWHLELLPLVKSVATAFDLKSRAYYCLPRKYAYDALWVFLSRDDFALDAPPRLSIPLRLEAVRNVSLMSDDFHSLMPFVTIAGGMDISPVIGGNWRVEDDKQ